MSHCVKVALLLLSISLLTACASHSEVRGAYPPKTPNTIKGAAAGGVIGTAVGGISTGTTGGTLAGLGLGAAMGAALGSYYDSEGLIVSLERQGITVIRLGDIVELVIPADLLFAGADTEIKREADPVMQQIVSMLQQYGDVNVNVEAYTDNIGSTLQKLNFSKLQAQSVTTYLWSHGIALDRLKFYGMDQQQTVASDLTILGSAYNRRVVISLWKQQQPSPLNVYAARNTAECIKYNRDGGCA